MLNKLFAAFLIAFAAISITPASAADIPVLTWEKGKEHNIILGGNSQVKDWKIQLTSSNGETLDFKQSKLDPKGYVVFSIQIPDSFESGIYTVVTTGINMPEKIVAGVKIVNLSDYNLIQVPTKLILILLTLILLISTLSIMRMQKYERIEYLRAKPTENLSGIFNLFAKFRVAAVEELHKSLFKFQIVREGELLHKLSPNLWATLPIATIFLGAYIGLNGRLILGVSLIPFVLYAIAAIIGVIDPFSGFTAALGFAFAQSISGNVTSVRSVMSLIAVGIGWVAPGILSSLYQDILHKDNYFHFAKKFVPDLVASAIGGLIFLVAQLLTNSFVDQVAPIAVSTYLIPLILTVAIWARINLYRYLVKDLHQTGKNYQIRILVLPRVLSPRTITFAFLYLGGTVYVWTESLQFAMVSSILLTTPLALLMVRFESPVIKAFKSAQRYIVIEMVCIATAAFISFFYIQSLPLEVTAKGKLLILSTSFVLFFHGFFSSVFDSSARANNLQVPQEVRQMAL
ncbi:MAG: hypothetical protein F2670_04995 [Actinobacteria bacterium]|uniref:Unannotated protein n=1 Tax=freshwater metagenome TaxID=449393 RepID=A0A6J6Q3K2_9ZZZZ|nr:hypothetical protein [Actinomycetota bacterium]